MFRPIPRFSSRCVLWRLSPFTVGVKDHLEAIAFNEARPELLHRKKKDKNREGDRKHDRKQTYFGFVGGLQFFVFYFFMVPFLLLFRPSATLHRLPRPYHMTMELDCCIKRAKKKTKTRSTKRIRRILISISSSFVQSFLFRPPSLLFAQCYRPSDFILVNVLHLWLSVATRLRGR